VFPWGEHHLPRPLRPIRPQVIAVRLHRLLRVFVDLSNRVLKLLLEFSSLALKLAGHLSGSPGAYVGAPLCRVDGLHAFKSSVPIGYARHCLPIRLLERASLTHQAPVLLRGSFRNDQRAHPPHVWLAIAQDLTLQLPKPSRLFTEILSGLLISAATVVHTPLEGFLLKRLPCLFGILIGLLEQSVNPSTCLSDGVKPALWVVDNPFAGSLRSSIVPSYSASRGLGA